MNPIQEKAAGPVCDSAFCDWHGVKEEAGQVAQHLSGVEIKRRFCKGYFNSKQKHSHGKYQVYRKALIIVVKPYTGLA